MKVLGKNLGIILMEIPKIRNMKNLLLLVGSQDPLCQGFFMIQIVLEE